MGAPSFDSLNFSARASHHCYDIGEGTVERDTKKTKYYYELLAAMGGDVKAMHNLGALEGNAGYTSRTMKHWMIAAGAGCDESLTNV